MGVKTFFFADESPRKQIRMAKESGKTSAYETRNTVVMQMSSSCSENNESGIKLIIDY